MGKFKAILEGASKMMEKDARKPSQPQYNIVGAGLNLSKTSKMLVRTLMTIRLWRVNTLIRRRKNRNFWTT